MPNDLVLAIDQGTTNTKAIVIDRDGKILARASVPMEIAFPRPAWVEQDPLAIWLSVQTVIDSCIGQIAPDKPGGDWNLQPAGNGPGLGSFEWSTAWAGSDLAMSPNRRFLSATS